MRSGRIDAPAKLNLTLEIFGRRDDGFHTLRSVVVPLALSDTLSWEPAPAYRFGCSDASLVDGENLVERAARMLNLDRCGVALHLEKRIPIGAGLGGGSSDAAALLRAAQRGAFPEIDRQRDWLSLARRLGSDVPLFLTETAVFVEHTGERLTPLGPCPTWAAILCIPPLHICTTTAYAQLDAERSTPPATRPRATSASIHLGTALQRADFDAVQGLLVNDFTTSTLKHHPLLANIVEQASRLGVGLHLTGSGSTLFALERDPARAEHTALRLREHLDGDLTILTTTLRRETTW